MTKGPAALIIAAAAVLPLASPAPAQTLDDAGGRYQMAPVNGGVARLDTVTGAIDLCRVEAEGIRCGGGAPAVAGEGSVPEAAGPATHSLVDTRGEGGGDGDRLDELTARLDDLKARVNTIEEALVGSQDAPDDGDADPSIERMQKIFEGFAGIVRELDRDLKHGDPKPDGHPHDDGPIPDHT